ncbi:hypothetical protein M0R45_018819 [Rubus argutus]|uniref:Plastocyanin-like domain-containing protein n=1 Tax=Rubus argutus TaxID=59490 RepID=A0AAW1X7D2_RUBAR
MNSQKNYSFTKPLGFIMLIVLSFLTVHGDVHHYDFVVKQKNYIRLCETKSMLVVNDSFPGPEIRVHKRDTVYVNVHNQGYYGFTIHWHGTNFTYEVILSEEEGTVWWHAHSDWTRASVHGAIVILPAIGTTFPFPQPDEDETIVVASWHKEELTPLIDAADLPASDAYTMNGQPGDLCPCSSDTTYLWKVDLARPICFV